MPNRRRNRHKTSGAVRYACLASRNGGHHHVQRQPFFQRSRPASIAAVAVAVLAAPAGVLAQALNDVKTPDKPLVLKAQGSFFVGGEKVELNAGELGDLGPGGHITVNQMYVHYMVPQGGD